MNATAQSIPSLRDKVSAEEWAVRVDLAASYRLVANFGWEDNAYTQLITATRPRGGRGKLVWPGLLRRLDRLDSSYQM